MDLSFWVQKQRNFSFTIKFEDGKRILKARKGEIRTKREIGKGKVRSEKVCGCFYIQIIYSQSFPQRTVTEVVITAEFRKLFSPATVKFDFRYRVNTVPRVLLTRRGG